MTWPQLMVGCAILGLVMLKIGEVLAKSLHSIDEKLGHIEAQLRGIREKAEKG